MSKIKKGIIVVVVLITFFITIISCATKVITGKYRTNFNSYGRFSKSFILDCDGKVTLNFSGDVLLNNSSYGVWKMKKDTLILFFDSLVNKNNRYKGEIKFLVKRNRIENISYPKSKYKETIRYFKKNKINFKDFPSYRKLNLTPKNFKGNMKLQYFKKIEDINCRK